MDIFYGIGNSVVVHASIMLLGILYFLFIEFRRLREFFFSAKNQLPSLHISKFFKLLIRLSVIYIPLLLIAMHGGTDKHPQLTGKYEVKQLEIGHRILSKSNCTDSVLTLVYFDIKNWCVFEFNTPQRRWNGHYEKKKDHLKIDWGSPADKPSFSGVLSSIDGSGNMTLAGMLGSDSIKITLHKISGQ
ncbi:MAG: hypothetical protein J7539_13100 [Niabella sp.]|nr:hypothetical protein [Niabella sp.]